MFNIPFKLTWHPPLCFETDAGVAVQLLAYKRGQFDPVTPLAKVEEPFRQLILHMINVNPGMPKPNPISQTPLIHQDCTRSTEEHRILEIISPKPILSPKRNPNNCTALYKRSLYPAECMRQFSNQIC